MELVLSGGELAEGDPLERLIDASLDVGVSAVELWYPKNFAAGLEGVRKALDAAGLRVACIGSATELGREAGTDRDAEILADAVRAAQELGAPFANTYFGWRSVRDDPAAIAAYRAALAPLLDLAADRDVILTLENEFDCFGLDPEGSDPTRRPQGARDLVEAVGHPHFRLALDPCNAHFAGCEAFPGFVEAVWPHVAQIHVKDGRRLSDGDRADPAWVEFRDEGRRYITCPLGEGALNWAGLFRFLRRNGYRGYLTLEPHAAKPFLERAWSQSAGACRAWIEEAGE